MLARDRLKQDEALRLGCNPALDPESCWGQQETQTCQTKELVRASRVEGTAPLPAPGNRRRLTRTRNGSGARESQNCHQQGRALLYSPGSHVKRTALCPRSLLSAPEPSGVGCAITLHMDLTNRYRSREGFLHPCGAPGGGGWREERDDGQLTPKAPCLILSIQRSIQPGPERVYCSPCPPQSKQQNQPPLPRAAPPRDAAHKQKPNPSSQTLREQGEGRMHPPNPPPPFIFAPPTHPGDAGKAQPTLPAPCIPPPARALLPRGGRS